MYILCTAFIIIILIIISVIIIRIIIIIIIIIINFICIAPFIQRIAAQGASQEK